jgi:hypothetical protein
VSGKKLLGIVSVFWKDETEQASAPAYGPPEGPPMVFAPTHILLILLPIVLVLVILYLVFRKK